MLFIVADERVPSTSLILLLLARASNTESQDNMRFENGTRYAQQYIISICVNAAEFFCKRLEWFCFDGMNLFSKKCSLWYSRRCTKQALSAPIGKTSNITSTTTCGWKKIPEALSHSKTSIEREDSESHLMNTYSGCTYFGDRVSPLPKTIRWLP